MSSCLLCSFQVEDRITDAKTVVSDVFKQSLCKVEEKWRIIGRFMGHVFVPVIDHWADGQEASTQLVEAVKDPDLQVTAASAGHAK